MARTRRSRRRRFRRSRWSSNIIDIGPNDFVLTEPQGWNHTEYTLVTNPDYSNSLTSNLYTIKNVDVALSFDMTGATSHSAIENLQFYIMYVPQGMTVEQDYAIQHPEYIMAMRYFGEPGKEQSVADNLPALRAPLRIKTRLSRKLNTGDRVILFIRAANVSTTTTVKTQYGGICRWWTKAN